MNIKIDDDVGAVADFMQRNFSAYRLCDIAIELARVAPLLWERYGKSPSDQLRLASLDSAGVREPSLSPQ